MQRHKSFKTQSWSLEVGDFIGMESCVDLGQNAQVPPLINGSGTGEMKEYLRRSRSAKHDRLTTTKEREHPPPIRTAGRCHRRSLSVECDWQTTTREEFPPPIGTVAKVCLRRSYSVKHDRQTSAIEKEFPPPIYSQRVLKRCYSTDGRLIIRQEEVRHLDCSRSNGRLTLKLIPPPAPAVVESFEDEAEEKNVEPKPQDQKDAGHEEINNGGKEVAVNSSPESTALRGGEGGVKCYRPLPCSFGMPVPAIRPCVSRIV